MTHALAPEWAVEPIRALSDNYVWALSDGHAAAVVDPGEAAPVADWLNRHGLTLSAILLTHHHHDHIGGTGALRRLWPDAVCYAPRDERIGDVDRRVGDGDRVPLPAPAAEFAVIAIPGHTRSHIAYHAPGVLFCGDTLFSVGCGRLFEGTPAQMVSSLNRLAALPDDTRVYCGHEYTAANCAFARRVEPGNMALAEHSRRVEALRDREQPTLPSTLGLERAINPFLRVQQPEIRATLMRERGLAADTSRVDAFAALREWKDQFRG